MHPASISQAPVLGQCYGCVPNRPSDLGMIGISEALCGMRAELLLAAGLIVSAGESQDQCIQVPVIGQGRGLDLYGRIPSSGVSAGLERFIFLLSLLLGSRASFPVLFRSYCRNPGIKVLLLLVLLIFAISQWPVGRGLIYGRMLIAGSGDALQHLI